MTPGFAELHVPGRPFLLPNAWDVLSALALAAAGYQAVGTTSLGITAAAGLLDGARAGLDLTLDLTERLAGRLSAHLSVDLEDGYSDDPARVADLVARLADLGVAGVNLEDAGRPAAVHARIVAAVRQAVPQVFVNARTDVFWSGTRQLPEALDRLRAYRDAGADGLFVPGLTDPAAVETAVTLGPPVNLLWQPGTDFAAQGVARVSTGSALYRHAITHTLAVAAAADRQRSPVADAISYAETQNLLAGR